MHIVFTFCISAHRFVLVFFDNIYTLLNGCIKIYLTTLVGQQNEEMIFNATNQRVLNFYCEICICRNMVKLKNYSLTVVEQTAM